MKSTGDIAQCKGTGFSSRYYKKEKTKKKKEEKKEERKTIGIKEAYRKDWQQYLWCLRESRDNRRHLKHHLGSKLRLGPGLLLGNFQVESGNHCVRRSHGPCASEKLRLMSHWYLFLNVRSQSFLAGRQENNWFFYAGCVTVERLSSYLRFFHQC